jgi:DNA mismatch repair protein MutH
MPLTSGRPAIVLNQIKSADELLEKAKWLEGKTLSEISAEIATSDLVSRVTTKGQVGHLIERGFFGIEKNSDSSPDIKHLDVEIKSCPLEYNKARNRLRVKEPLSLNIINYREEATRKNVRESSLYRKNKNILFILYIHDELKQRSDYLVKYVFLWKMDDGVINELSPDYDYIVEFIKKGEAHLIHQKQHKFLTLCPKHGGTFKDPSDKKSKTSQPFSEIPAEVRGFRLKNRYMNLIISRHLGKVLGWGGWNL